MLFYLFRLASEIAAEREEAESRRHADEKTMEAARVMAEVEQEKAALRRATEEIAGLAAKLFDAQQVIKGTDTLLLPLLLPLLPCRRRRRCCCCRCARSTATARRAPRSRSEKVVVG